jgi:hypothetical protein
MQIWRDGMADAGDAKNKTENLQQELDDPVKNIIGPAFAALPAAILAGLSWLTFHFTDVMGWALTSLIWLAEIIFIAWLVAKFIQYFGDLGAGADAIGSRKRRAYDALREDLREGGRPAILYSRYLPVFLDAVDRLFGDARTANRTLFHRVLRLKTPAPLWTAPALERCLLLALIYPVATILVVWAVSGHVGPAENALHLNPRLIVWQRWLAATVFGFSMFELWRAARTTGWKRLVHAIVYIVAFVIAVGLWVAPAGATVVSGAYAASPMIQVRTFFRGGGGVALPPAITIAVAFLGALIVAGAIAVISSGLGALQRFKWEGAFLTLFIPGMILACFGAAVWLSSLPIWQILGPLLLFLGLLTLLNAPFDWFSLGLTRALLRRGLELGGWAPYFLALLDAALAAGVIVALTLAMVIGVQFFDAAGVHGGGKAVLPLDALFNGIAANPWAPEYWWIYVLLVSTMIPSLVNLVIGGIALVRGLPILPGRLLRSIPEGEAIPIGNRFGVALVLTGQLAVGFLLGMAAQIILVVYILGHVMPLFGLELLDMARGVAAFNLPARVGQLFGAIR